MTPLVNAGRGIGAASNLRAVILAGGKGTRLAPFTASFPKPLVPLGNKPVLEVLIAWLHSHGITDITLTLGHLKALLRAYFAESSDLSDSLRLRYVEESTPTGTAGSLAMVPDLDETFLVMNGDLLTNLNLHELVAWHRARGAAVTIAAHRRRVKVDLGVLDLDAAQDIVGYHEKPEHLHHVSMGVYVYEPHVLRYITSGQYLDFPDLVHRLLAAGEKVSAFVNESLWLDIGRPDDYARAQELFAERREEFELV